MAHNQGVRRDAQLAAHGHTVQTRPKYTGVRAIVDHADPAPYRGRELARHRLADRRDGRWQAAGHLPQAAAKQTEPSLRNEVLRVPQARHAAAAGGEAAVEVGEQPLGHDEVRPQPLEQPSQGASGAQDHARVPRHGERVRQPPPRGEGDARGIEPAARQHAHAQLPPPESVRQVALLRAHQDDLPARAIQPLRQANGVELDARHRRTGRHEHHTARAGAPRGGCARLPTRVPVPWRSPCGPSFRAGLQPEFLDLPQLGPRHEDVHGPVSANDEPAQPSRKPCSQT